ncbi:MAG: phenylalanine--tRNA ligase subunit beta [Candidatus Micrarchaeota archaeon]
MVTITVKKDHLKALVGRHVPDSRLEDALAQVKAAVDAETADEYSLEVTGDRPDLLSAEGVARAVRGRLGFEKGLPESDFADSGVHVVAEESATRIRPYIVGAVVRNLRLSEDGVAALFQTQEKLDLTHGRRRGKVSIGLYDMGRLKPPFRYRAADPGKTAFIPLKSDRKMTLSQILLSHPKGIENAHLLEGHRQYPVLEDSVGEILSLIPIINGVSSAVTPGTTELFIDHTGSDLSALNSSLNILCRDFADSGAKVETVEVIYGGKRVHTPNTHPQRMELDVAYANRMLGTALSAEKMGQCLARQCIGATARKEGRSLECLIPPYRADFIHPADLVEEVALGHGYNDFEPKPPDVYSKGSLLGSTFLQDIAEEAMVGAGYLQVACHCTTNDCIASKAALGEGLARISNPVSEEFDRIRSHILPGVLNLLSKNTHEPYPQKVFEIGQTVERDSSSDTGYATRLKACGATAHAAASLSESAGVLSSLLSRLGWKFSLKPLESGRFIDGRGARILLHRDGKEVDAGFIGELHPLVLQASGLQVPCAAFELAID